VIYKIRVNKKEEVANISGIEAYNHKGKRK
jgi:hypothetical protein